MNENIETYKNVPKGELDDRMKRFMSAMDKTYPDWGMCAVVGAVNMYYLTGTIQDGTLLIERGKSATLWVRRSYDRAVLESEFQDIRRMGSFRDVAPNYKSIPETLYLDMSEANMQWYRFLTKYMPFKKTLPVDAILLKTRSVKSQYEIKRMRKAGGAVSRLLREEAPLLMREDMSEVDLGAELFSLFLRNGHHGITRFSMHNVDPLLGHVGFGESTFYPSVFNGASGQVGLCPAAPVLGNRQIKLKHGDLVYIDVVFGVEGYNSDKTQVYSFGKRQSAYVEDVYRHCIELEKLAVSMLRPGTKPSEIYNAVLKVVQPKLRECFMGAAGRTVPFLGHGTGLYVDEWPVITNGFDDPLECGMTIAIEPKFGIEGVGIVGSENTYLITEQGAECMTGGIEEIILCPV
ncbi:MAG: M24 family metallopeptidase [Oscillospiraceae bacterium]|nr:M24 family metallopeptidase [Oscillospiraceae bacterium]